MDVISQNIANVNTTHGPDGKPYQRQHVVFETVLQQVRDGVMSNVTEPVRVSHIAKDSRPAKLVYSPGHPDADSEGMVAMPDINLHEEMVDLIAASRTFEANLAVMKNAKALALQTLTIGRRS